MFVIVRHGNTFAAGETPRRIGARTDLPLVSSGIAQAEALGRHFAARQWHFARVLVSPLIRTRETARLILRHQPAPPEPELCDWLREIDHGPDEDQPEDAVRARIGHDALAAWDERAAPPPGWIVDRAERLIGWRTLFADELADPAMRLTLVVTSNGAARYALLADPALVTAKAGLSNLKLPTGGYGLIARGPDGRLQVPVWGQRP